MAVVSRISTEFLYPTGDRTGIWNPVRCGGQWLGLSPASRGLDGPCMARTVQVSSDIFSERVKFLNKKHLKNVGPIRDCEPPHAHSPGVATVARRLRIDVHNNIDNNDNNDNA